MQSLMNTISSITSAIFSLDSVYGLTGLALWIFAAMTFRDRDNPRRIASGMFWLILGVIFAFGGIMPHAVTGLLVLIMVGIDGAGGVRRGNYNEATRAEQSEQARRLKDKIFLPVLTIPLVT